jgi:peptidoglycan hydrolase-like protein with peptidoglycan-binding domain
MVYSLTWLGPVLKGAGLKVAPDFGWESRGLGDVGETVGVICHHTATAGGGNFPTHHTLVHGREDLRGPLAQLGLGRDGTFYLIAAGLCQHAGPGSFREWTKGNTHFVGIEAENSGAKDDPWPPAQLDAYKRGVAAILKHIGRGAEFCIGHKEWAPTRKTDPTFDMNKFRAGVAEILNGSAAPPVLIPAREPGNLLKRGRPTLRRGDDDKLVPTIQRALKITPTSTHFGPKTEAALRAFQRERGMVPDGIVGPKTWDAIDRAGAGANA